MLDLLGVGEDLFRLQTAVNKQSSEKELKITSNSTDK